ncbi:hypothetical protein C2G38_2153870 [Gigaspora rosea]|uniref:Aspartic peptidase domain-containing protein n=1 Tax=Gigaspora rosea TaxID=44941 RepID=A0A397W5H7_9GLOM|nr:hypothetical protein C2G38_2153870 [Gigaspora rosea]
MAIGLPMNIEGSETIPDTTFGNQIIGIALSVHSEDVGKWGSIMFGGIDLGYIIGNYSNGDAMIDCNTSSTFDISFEIANKKWRLPSSGISKDSINGTSKCESINTGGSTKSQLGMALQSDINYGSAGCVRIYLDQTNRSNTISLPEDTYIKCLTEKKVHTSSLAANVSNDQKSQEGIILCVFVLQYSFHVLTPSTGNCFIPCMAYNESLNADITNDPWAVTLATIPR